jgi:ferredoxin
MPDGGPKARTYLRVRVNPIKCTAFGFCAEFLPEVFDLDDWGYAWVQRPDVPATLAGAVWKTARSCPTGAILVDEVTETDEDNTTNAARGSRSRTR